MQSYLQHLSQRLVTAMPKSPTRLPLSGIFAVAKPSGPTSMSLVNGVKRHIAGSRLFVEEDKLKDFRAQGRARKKSKYGREAVKIGQGGTLDPLADGVLGKIFLTVGPYMLKTHLLSDWDRKRHKEADRILGLCQGISLNAGISCRSLFDGSSRNIEQLVYLDAKQTLTTVKGHKYAWLHGIMSPVSR